MFSQLKAAIACLASRLYPFDMKAFYFWASVLPILSVLILWKIEQSSSAGIGYALPLIALVCMAVVFVAAAVIGLLTKTVIKSLLGALVSLPLSALAIFLFLQIKDSANSASFNRERTQMATLFSQLEKNKDGPLETERSPEEISKSFQNLNGLSIPLAFCHLMVEKNPTFEANLKITQALTTLPLSLGEKDFILYHSLNQMARGEDPKIFSKWLELWDQLHPNTKPKWIRAERLLIAIPANDFSCQPPTDASFASIVFQVWKEAGMRIWLETEHAMTPAQQRLALQKVQSPAMLDQLIQSGVDLKVPHPKASSGGSYQDSVWIERSYSWSTLINESSNPMQVAELVRAFVRHGARLEDRSADGKTACEIFKASEFYVEDPNYQSKERLALTKKAGKTVRRILCSKFD